ncbi:hypothetical protein [Streptomyces sp. NRRL WC-3626]|uniref:hypothetical protein n=1 Tax=Streptomyces sp. NRRL WC-3626 TaxID=1463926 RepID=UPI0004C14476|nr:hypothetical protein [Streptomyces sp. NRRL WC-3626]
MLAAPPLAAAAGVGPDELSDRTRALLRLTLDTSQVGDYDAALTLRSTLREQLRRDKRDGNRTR